ncbi:MAG: hypothetical protein ACYC2H_01475 [Thermoplasmatota archaeon]
MTTQPKPKFIYVFDPNRRVYEKNLYSRPIWRGHWRKKPVIAETSRSWVLPGYDHIKVPKRGHDPRKFAFTADEIRMQEYRQRVHLVLDALQIQSSEVIKQVADLIGFTMPEPVWPESVPEDERI